MEVNDIETVLRRDDLKSLFPSFDSELACILHTTLNVTQEAHNHLCEDLILANIKSWGRFVTSLANPFEVACLEYDRGREGWQPISLDDQWTLNTFIDLVFHMNSQNNGEWYDISQYNMTVFLQLCNARARFPGLAAIQNKATATIPLAPFPRVTAKVPLASSSLAQTKPCLTTPSPTLVPPPAPAPLISSTPTVHHGPHTTVCQTPVHSTVDNPKTTSGHPCHSNSGSVVVSTSTGTPS
eukprot:jgi/Psemu1/39514/gm1.39514_g